MLLGAASLARPDAIRRAAPPYTDHRIQSLPNGTARSRALGSHERSLQCVVLRKRDSHSEVPTAERDAVQRCQFPDTSPTQRTLQFLHRLR